MSRPLRLAFAALLLCPLTARADLPVVTDDYWIIVTGSKDQKETERLLAAVMKRWPAAVELDKGYPKIESSDGRKGLNPGFHIAVAGVCSKEADATAVRDAIRKAVPGAYVRKVARYLPGFIPDCPRLKVKPVAKEPKVPKGYTLTEEGPAKRDGLVWKIYSAPTADKRCGKHALVRLLDSRGGLVDERQEEAHCVEGDPEVDGSGESRSWSAFLSTNGSTDYVLLTYEQWASDTGCNGGSALCATASGIVEEELEGECNATPYREGEGEKHCVE